MSSNIVGVATMTRTAILFETRPILLRFADFSIGHTSFTTLVDMTTGGHDLPVTYLLRGGVIVTSYSNRPPMNTTDLT